MEFLLELQSLIIAKATNSVKSAQIAIFTFKPDPLTILSHTQLKLLPSAKLGRVLNSFIT